MPADPSNPGNIPLSPTAPPQKVTPDIGRRKIGKGSRGGPRMSQRGRLKRSPRS